MGTGAAVARGPARGPGAWVTGPPLRSVRGTSHDVVTRAIGLSQNLLFVSDEVIDESRRGVFSIPHRNTSLEKPDNPRQFVLFSLPSGGIPWEPFQTETVVPSPFPRSDVTV